MLEKLIFENQYHKFLFYENLIQYVKEKKCYANIEIVSKNDLHYSMKIKRLINVILISKKSNSSSNFVKNILFMIFYTIYKLLSNVSFSQKKYSNSLLSCIESFNDFNMINELLSESHEIKFVIENQYASEFPVNFLKKNKIEILHLDFGRFALLLKVLFIMIMNSFTNVRNFISDGLFPYNFYKILCQGFEITPNLNGVKYFCCSGHLTLARAFRNQFLKSVRCKSIYISKNSYMTYQQLPAERQINYDIFCSSGKHAEDLYQKKKTLTKRFIVTGSYDGNYDYEKQIPEKKGIFAQIQRVKKNDKCIVILSPGICDETLSVERKLIKFTKSISNIKNIKILFRKKPTDIEPKYKNFYDDLVVEKKNIFITPDEMYLNELLNIGDLFITSISSSATDLLIRGAKIYFIDFNNTPKLYLPWEKYPQLVLDEKSAFSTIKTWIKSNKNAKIRYDHEIICNNLRNYMGPINNDFKTYKSKIVKVFTS